MPKFVGTVEEKKINLIKEFPEEDYLLYKAACEELLVLDRGRELFEFVRLNYLDYKSFIIAFLEEGSASAKFDKYMQQLNIDINRRVSNLLASIRAYIDHSKRGIGTDTLTRKTNSTLFKKACDELCNKEFAFHFILEFRNYVQHCGMPIYRMQYSESIENLEEAINKRELRLLASRDELLKSHRWRELKTPIEELPEYFEIDSYLEISMKCLEELEKEKWKDYGETLAKSVERILEALEHFEGYGGTPCIVTLLKKNGGSLSIEEMKNNPEISVNLEWLPIEVIKALLDNNG